MDEQQASVSIVAMVNDELYVANSDGLAVKVVLGGADTIYDAVSDAIVALGDIMDLVNESETI